MKIRTAELTRKALNWAVAKCEGYYITLHADGMVLVHPETGDWHHNNNWRPTESWVIGGPIIEREKIRIDPSNTGKWHAAITSSVKSFSWWMGNTPLEAAMRCYVASKLGNEIEIPEALIHGE